MAAIDLTAGLDISDAAKKLKELRDAAKMAVSGVAGDIDATEALFDHLADQVFKAKENVKKAQSEISTNQEWIQKLRKQAAEAQEALSMAPTNASKKRAQKELDGINQALNEELGLLDFNKQKLQGYNQELTQNQKALKMAQTELKAYQKDQQSAAAAQNTQNNALKGTSASYSSIRSQITAVRNEMADLTRKGQQNSERYKELQNELGQLATAYRKVQFEQKALSTGATQWAGIQSILQGIMGGFAAYQGVLGLVADSSEDLVKIQTRLQSVMGVIMGMTQVSNTLHSTSAARMTTLAKVTDLWNAANLRVGKGLIRMGVAANTARIAAIAMNGVLTLGLGAAIGVAISAITKLVDKHKEAKKAAEEAAKKQREAFDSYASSVGQNAGDIIAKFEALKRKYNELGDSLSAKKKFIKENADAFKELGVKVGDVNDADNLFIKNADAFVASVDARARAAATMKVAAEKYEEAFKKMLEVEKIKNVANDESSGLREMARGLKDAGVSYTKEERKKLDERLKEARKNVRTKIKFNEKGNRVDNEGNELSTEDILKLYDEARNEALKLFVQEVLLPRMEEEQKNLENKGSQAAVAGYDFNKAAQEALKDAGIVTTDEADAAERARKEAEKRAKAEADAQKKLSDIIASGELSLWQSKIDAMNEGLKKELEQLDLNTQKKIDAILQERKKELDAYNKANGLSGEKAVTELPDDREKEYAERIKNTSDTSAAERVKIEERHAQQLKDIYKQSVDATISEEDRKIGVIKERYAKLRDEIAKMLLAGDINNKQAETLYGQIDVSEQQEILAQILNGVKSYEQQRLEIQEKYQKKRESLYQKEGKTLKEGVTQENVKETDYQEGEALAAIDEAFAQREATYQVWMEEIANWSLERLKKALEEAKQELQALEESGTADSSQLSVARAKVNKLEKNVAKEEAKTNSPNAASDKNIKKWQRLRKTLTDVEKEFQEIGDAIGGTAGEAISLAGTVAASTIEIIDGIETLVNGTAEAVTDTTETASKSIQAMETASVILAIISAALKIAMAIAKFVQKESKATKNYEELKVKYEALVDVWDSLIERKQKYIDISWGKELTAVNDQTQALIQQKIESQRALAAARASAGASAGSHSYGYRMWQGSYKANGQNWKDVAGNINEELDVNIQGMSDFASLSAEQLLWIKENYAELWAAMDGDFRDALEHIIEYEDEAAEAIEAYKEQLTQISFDELYGNFVDTLMDMEASSEDFADNLSEMLMRAVLSSMMGQKYAQQLEQWYDKFSQYMDEGEGVLTEQQINALKDEYMGYVDAAIAERDKIASIIGYSGESADAQSASVRGFQAMSQDTGDELNGRFTDIQGKVTDIRDYVLQITANGAMQLNEVINIRDIMIQLNGNVADIRDNTNTLHDMNETLISMNRKLDNL